MAIRIGSPDSSRALLSPGASQAFPRKGHNASRVDNVKRFLRTTAGRILILGILAWLTAYAYCKQRFWRDPHSWFYSEDGVYDFKYSRQRQMVAHDFIAAANATPEAVDAKNKARDPVLCVAVMTVKRKKEFDYLNGTIGSMLAGLTPEERSVLDVHVVFLDPDPSIHPDWNNTWLDAVDSWSGYNLSDDKIDELKRWPKIGQEQRKATFDTVYVLEHCLNQTSAPYIAMVEDDVLFADGWLPKALSALGEIRQKPDPWLYLRLFYTETRLGWDKEIDNWYTHPIFCVSMTLTTTLILTLLARIVHKRHNPDSDTSTCPVIGCVLIPLLIALIFMIGRNSLLPLHGLTRMDEKGCCNQALIFPRKQVPHVTDLLKEHKPSATDLVIEEWADEMGLARYAITPQVVQHIGLISTRGMPKFYTRQTWAYFFEDQDAEQLKQEHDWLARWGIWRTMDQDYADP